MARPFMSDPQQPYRSLRQSLRQLLWHWMMGTMLGIVCAGLLLNADITALASLDNPASFLGRLVFLGSVGIAFGLGAVLTGAMLLAFEES